VAVVRQQVVVLGPHGLHCSVFRHEFRRAFEFDVEAPTYLVQEERQRNQRPHLVRCTFDAYLARSEANQI